MDKDICALALSALLCNGIIHYQCRGETHQGKELVLRGAAKAFDIDRICKDISEITGASEDELKRLFYALKNKPSR